MQTLLIVITCVAVAVAALMGVLFARLWREERQRSDARVAALSAMSRTPSPAVDPGARTASARRPAPARPPQTPVGDLELRPASSEPLGIFAQREDPSPWGARLSVAAILAVIVVGTAYVALPSRGPQPVAGEPPAAASAPDRGPLELLSLSHARQGEALVISGLVQNPRGGTALRHVVATGIVFGAGGEFLASGRAGIDFTTLAPGDESPFVVTIPVTGTVARYRVGFRTDNGEIIAHVDRRTASEALARR
jgi:hypothetical protein